MKTSFPDQYVNLDGYESSQQRLTNSHALILAPKTISDTGLSESLLRDLTCKHLYASGSLTTHNLSQKLALAGPVINEILQSLRRDSLIEVKPSQGSKTTLAYGFTERGRTHGVEAIAKSGYIGPAPVPAAAYQTYIKENSIHKNTIGRDDIDEAFKEFVIHPVVKDRLGMAVNSGRAIFIYGPAGSGKTYTISKLTSAFSDYCLIPYSIAVGDTIIEVFDPLIHQVKPKQLDKQTGSLRANLHQDPRWLECKRPIVVCGGELTMDMLEIRYNPEHRQYQAPLQLKANGGIFIIDDMGRQKPSPAEIFNRWIVPMEEKVDYLSLGTGRHFEIPFDQILIFSSNINPLDLADEAFLRRIGYKIKFEFLQEKSYEKLWRKQCQEHDVEFNVDTFFYLTNELHKKSQTPLLPCHPRDLFSIAHDHARYLGQNNVMTRERIHWAWRTYFVDFSEHDRRPEVTLNQEHYE